MGDKCVCHLNGYQIKDSIARKAIEDLQKAFDGLEIADGLDLEEIKQLIQNEIAKIDTTGLTESEVKELINSAWDTYEEPLINQKIEEAIAGVDTFTKEEAQEMHANMLNDINTSVDSKITEAVTSAETVMDEKIETALAGFEGGGSAIFQVIYDFTNNLDSSLLDAIRKNPQNFCLASSSSGSEYYYFSGKNKVGNLYYTRLSYDTSLKRLQIIIQYLTPTSTKFTQNTLNSLYTLPTPSSENAGKVVAVKADGTGYELIDL